MNELEHKILIHLKNHHRGNFNAITFKALSVELGINSRELRLYVSNIVSNGEGCIGSDSVSGYYYITTDEELNYCHGELVSRIKKLAKRAKGLRQARIKDRQEVEPKQLSLLGAA